MKHYQKIAQQFSWGSKSRRKRNKALGKGKGTGVGNSIYP